MAVRDAAKSVATGAAHLAEGAATAAVHTAEALTGHSAEEVSKAVSKAINIKPSLVAPLKLMSVMAYGLISFVAAFVDFVARRSLFKLTDRVWMRYANWMSKLLYYSPF